MLKEAAVVSLVHRARRLRRPDILLAMELWRRKQVVREIALDDEALMQLAFVAAQTSPNRIRKVGAAILICDDGAPIAACNTFPKGVADLDERHAGDGRFVWMEHAERNAIFTAARAGRALAGGRIASTLFPCVDCARAIVISGIETLVTYPPPLDDPVWGASFPRSRIILEEGGVELVFLNPKP